MMNNDTERAPATEEKIVELAQYNGRKELSEVDYWYFGDEDGVELTK